MAPLSGLRIRLRPTIFPSSLLRTGAAASLETSSRKIHLSAQDLLDSAFGTVFSRERLETKLRGKRSQSCKSDKFVTFGGNELNVPTESHDRRTAG